MCKFIIHYYTQFTVHKLGPKLHLKTEIKKKKIPTAFFGLPLMPQCPLYLWPPECFFETILEFEQGEQNGCLHWSSVGHVETILTKFKLLNIISAQLVDSNVTIDHYTHITVHKLGQNYI